MPIAGNPPDATGTPLAVAPAVATIQAAADDRVSRLFKRRLAMRAFWALSILDVSLIGGALASPEISARVGKVEFVVATVNAAWASIVGAYMGFSFAAQWKRA